MDSSAQPCRICNGPTLPSDSRGGIECQACGCLMVSEIPSEQELSDYYNSYNASYTGGGRSGGDNQQRYAEKYLELVTRRHRQGDLIDIGCANNPFPNVASRCGFRVTAADYRKPDHLDSAVDFRHGHLGSTSLLMPGDSFDVVTAWAVAEHVTDPMLAFRILAGLMKPGGCVHLTTPEHGTWITDAALGKTRWFYPPEHLHLLTPRAVAILAEKNGLRLVEWRHFELNLPRWLARYGIGLAEALPGWLLETLSASRWDEMRKSRQSRFTGIAYYRIERA
jgi:hypothetical protein